MCDSQLDLDPLLEWAHYGDWQTFLIVLQRCEAKLRIMAVDQASQRRDRALAAFPCPNPTPAQFAQSNDALQLVPKRPRQCDRRLLELSAASDTSAEAAVGGASMPRPSARSLPV